MQLCLIKTKWGEIIFHLLLKTCYKPKNGTVFRTWYSIPCITSTEMSVTVIGAAALVARGLSTLSVSLSAHDPLRLSTTCIGKNVKFLFSNLFWQNTRKTKTELFLWFVLVWNIATMQHTMLMRQWCFNACNLSHVAICINSSLIWYFNGSRTHSLKLRWSNKLIYFSS